MLFKKEKYDVKLSIEGMSCNHCKMATQNALNKIDGVEAEVDLKKKCATINLSKEVSDDTLKESVKEAGFHVTGIERK